MTFCSLPGHHPPALCFTKSSFNWVLTLSHIQGIILIIIMKLIIENSQILTLIIYKVLKEGETGIFVSRNEVRLSLLKKRIRTQLTEYPACNDLNSHI